ncbi:MAG: hypothetical protein ACKVOU_13505 [Cytophagales bacterium]
MKNIVKIALFALVFTSSQAFARTKDDKATLKSRQIVENATPDDWKALADAAAICVAQKTNLTQASEWLTKSLSIKESAYNLEIKGDYLLLSNQPTEAIAVYIKAMQSGLNLEKGFEVKNLQEKIAALRAAKN